MATDLLLRMYTVAIVTRTLDQHLWHLSRQGRASFVLTGRGHEIAQIASVATMRPGHDFAWPYYRDMGVGLALGVTPYEILLGALGRAADPHSGGRQLTMHLSSGRLRIGSISSEIAAHIPHAVGCAYAATLQREEPWVSMCWFGDGATSEGATHEAMNFAGIHRLPVVFLCENNGYAISVPISLQCASARLSDRASAYDMPGHTVDGTDACASYHAVASAVGRAREGGGPSFVELIVPRMTPHSSQDDDSYRTGAELEVAQAADPIPRLRDQLCERGALAEDEDAALRMEIDEWITADEDAALAQPVPSADRARRWLFAGDEPPIADATAHRFSDWRGVFA